MELAPNTATLTALPSGAGSEGGHGNDVTEVVRHEEAGGGKPTAPSGTGALGPLGPLLFRARHEQSRVLVEGSDSVASGQLAHGCLGMGA